MGSGEHGGGFPRLANDHSLPSGEGFFTDWGELCPQYPDLFGGSAKSRAAASDPRSHFAESWGFEIVLQEVATLSFTDVDTIRKKSAMSVLSTAQFHREKARLSDTK